MMTLQNEFFREFDRLNSLIDELYHDIAAKQGLSDSAYSVLQAIAVLGEGCTQTEVYRHCGLNKQTVNSCVTKLRRDGVLDCRPGVGREVKLYFTDAGKTVVAEKIAPIEALENETFDEMTAVEREEILRLLNKYLTVFRGKLERWEARCSE